MAAVLPGDGGWIVSTSLDKPDLKTRRLIRSHVMRGKNTREDRKLRKQRKEKKEGNTSDTSLESPNRDPGWFITSPRKVASEISTFGYGLEMQPYMEELIYRAYTLIKPSSFSLEQTLVGRKQDDLFCFANLSRSDAMVHSVLFSTQAFRDLYLNVPRSDVARWHEAQTLFHLQRMLNDQQEALATPNLAIVASLASAAVFSGDFETAEKHVSGLWRMIELKGGFDVVGRGGMLEHKAQRLDFGLSLSTGQKVRYIPEKQSWSPALALDNARKIPELDMIQPRPEPKLLNIWVDVRQFALAANQATSSNIKIPPAHMKVLATSVPWRLTNLEYDIDTDPLPELVRLCLLAFVKSILSTIRGMGRAMYYMTTRLKAALLTQRYRTKDERMNRFLLWACLVSSISIFEDTEQNWLQDMLIESSSALGVSTWEQTRAIMKAHKFPWIDILYDEPSESIFNQYLRPVQTLS